MKIELGVYIIMFAFFSCFNNIPKLIIDKSEGWSDLVLSLNQLEKKNDGSFLLKIKNRYKNDNIGFNLKIDSSFKTSKPEGFDTPIYWGTGEFINIGKETEKFIMLLADLYNVKVKKIMSHSIPVAFVALEGNPNNILNESLKMKFFFNADSENDDLYSEIYINTDISNKFIYFNEKDVEYRLSLINSLCGRVD